MPQFPFRKFLPRVVPEVYPDKYFASYFSKPSPISEYSLESPGQAILMSTNMLSRRALHNEKGQILTTF